MQTRNIVLPLLLVLAMVVGTIEANAQALRPIRVKDGVFRYSNGQEVALFGTNYLPMSWQQYVNMKACKADFAAAIRQDVAEMKKCGVQVVRICSMDSEISDKDGNLIDNVHLRIFDMLVAELDRQGIYLYLTALTWFESPNARPDAFRQSNTKMAMMYKADALRASERYVHQLLNHKNSITGRRLKDEPALAVIEIINEPFYWPWEAVANWPGFKASKDYIAEQTRPEVFEQDFVLWRGLWRQYLETRQLTPSREIYNQFQTEIMSAYLKRMIKAIRGAGASQPIASAIYNVYRNPGVLTAIGQSQVDAVTDGWYPGGFFCHEQENLFKEAENYQLPEAVRKKAKLVYEFDVCGTYYNVGMYPAMARRYRSMGAQIACQFQYDPAITAAYNNEWGVHYFNYLYTPAKTVAFNIASRAFSLVPRNATYPTPADRQVFGPFAIAIDPKQALMATPDELYYANSLEGWSPLSLPEQPRVIMGRGRSPLAEYDGSGFYRIERAADRTLTLFVSPDTILHGPIDKSFFANASLTTPMVRLDQTTPRRFQLRLKGWERFACQDPQGQPVPVEQGGFTVKPGGTYRLTRLAGAKQ